MLRNKSQHLLNIFTADDLNLMLQSLERIPDKTNTGQFYAYTNGFTQQDLLYQLFERKFFTKIERQLGHPLNIRCGMFLKEEKPWIIHTDYVRPFDSAYDGDPGLAFLIPLQVVGSNNQTTHTVVFNELCLTDFDDFKKNNPKINNNSLEIYKNYCSHVSKEDLEYVTLQGAYSWTPGSVIIWDRTLLHCSDNFIQNSIKEKQALVLFG
jgi:hypothetical protein